MLKFIRSKGNQQPSAERQKLQKELYAFRKVSQAKVIKSFTKINNSYDINIYFTRLRYKSFDFVQNTTSRFLSAQNTEKKLQLNDFEVCPATLLYLGWNWNVLLCRARRFKRRAEIRMKQFTMLRHLKQSTLLGWFGC